MYVNLTGRLHEQTHGSDEHAVEYLTASLVAESSTSAAVFFENVEEGAVTAVLYLLVSFCLLFPPPSRVQWLVPGPHRRFTDNESVHYRHQLV